MHDTGRRVRKLRITSNDETVITSQVNALEDAFRIASFPGLPPHGLVMIRHLDLGSFSTTVSSMTLSQLIDKKTQNIASIAVCVDTEEHPEANVVWFSDPIQPLIYFLILLLENKTPKAWYWKLQIPTWHSAMDFSQSLSCIIQTAVDGVSRKSASNEIIQLLLNYGKAEEIFRVLTPQLAIQLLNEVNHFPHLLTANTQDRHSKIDIRQNLNVRWLTLITRAVDYWGEDDPRTIWLTYTVLIKDNPCLENSDEISQIISHLINQCSHKNTARTQVKTMGYGVEGVARIKVERVVENNKPLFPRPFTPEHSVEALHQKDLQEAYKLGQKPEYYQTKDKSQKLKFSDERSDLADKIMSDNEESADPIYPKGIEATRNEIEHQANKFQYSEYGFKFSAYSGLGFIIPLLEYIGIQDILTLNPWLAEVNFPGRIIKAVAARLGINKHDPAFKIVPKLPGYSDLEDIQFVSPAIWEPLIYWPDDINKIACQYIIAGKGQTCYITDKTKRFLLYVGDTDRAAFPEWLSNIRIIDKQGVFSAPSLADLEMSSQLLFGKFLRHYAQTGLKQLMQREGQLAITKTHLDILFDSCLVDNSIRRAGLDINPGWVSWFGKVVQFYYDYEGYAHV